MMMWPSSNVSPLDKLSMIVGISKIMSRVLPSCITSPLTRQISRTCCGSGKALLWTIHGPHRTKSIQRFSLEPLSVLTLELAGGHIEAHRVTEHVVVGFVFWDVTTFLSHNDGQFDFPVEFVS